MASFRDAVRWAFFAGMVVWMPLVVAAYFVGPERHHDGMLVVGVNGALLVVAAVACAKPEFPAWLVFLLQYAVFVFDWMHTAGPSTPFAVATFHLFIITAVAQGLVLRRRIDLVLSLACCVAVAVLIYLADPEQGTRFPLFLLANGPLAIVVGRPGLVPLLRFARSLDTNHHEAVRARTRLDVQTAAMRRAAEEQRQVHDTAINTLAAVARGGSAVSDLGAVRARCHADTQVLEHLMSSSGLDLTAHESPEAPLARRTVTVDLTGLSGQPLADLWAGMPLGVRAALGGATGELVTNAEKHAGVARVSVDIRADGAGGGGVRVVVSDQGRGFAPEDVAERGLASSVRARLAEEGIAFDLRTAPGAGVRAAMSWRADGDQGAGEAADFRVGVDRVSMVGALLISALLAGGGIFLGAANHPGELTPDYLLAALVITTTLLAWRSWRRHDRLTGAMTAVLVVTAPIAFLVSGSGVDFGQGYVLAWQCIAPAMLLFIVVAGTRSARVVAIGTAAYAAVGAAAAFALTATPAAGAVTFVMLATGLVWVGGWVLFNLRLRRMAARAIREHEAAVRADEAAEAQATAAQVRARWRLAGIESAADLLRALGSTLDPASPEARHRSGLEETYLRQVVLLPPELVNIGAWFCQALSTARERDVNLQVRSGPHDIAPGTADLLGQYVVDATTVVDPGTDLVVSLLEGRDGLQLRLVATDSRIAELARERDWDSGLELEIQQYAQQVLVRVGPRAAA
ncbi:hypothetical protein GUY44_02990 [Pimelobacter simplex]|uniref:Two-component system, sensor protein n=1 Tax=Nocardioides simplex TaxID=2045 RepID=A0A0A1DRR0_NOCSI|nr:ATP-binding protein [Pimelobacter simplex]AIY19317.1 Two-component system, sensor protein [Pimelobacter simplex]MCG8149432.1 hypothetical protein [Pimelobacter simplex]SFM19187.1 Signal transduction histidine kinase [Pimelobacter simplex]